MTRTIVPGDREWPAILDELGELRSPDHLYVDGRPLENEAPAVAVVGTRRPTVAGIDAAIALATGLAEAGITVVSGMAVGIDAAAHRAALDAGGRTVAVLGCGLDVEYPYRNRHLKRELRARGTLVSEYPEGTAPQKWQFPERNRIIAGLSLGVVVVEGAMTSGALVTARLALDANRAVFAVPGSFRNRMADGPNELIRTSQAALVTSVEHIVEDLAPHLVTVPRPTGPKEAVTLDADARAVLDVLDDAPVGLERLSSSVGDGAGRVAVALAQLEMLGLAAKMRGGYAITSHGARTRASALSGSQ